jgi:hypothetical protein
VGDQVRSADDGSDVISMKNIWRAVIVKVRSRQVTTKRAADDGLVYQTVGRWDPSDDPLFAEDNAEKLTLRQLWSENLQDDEQKAVDPAVIAWGMTG